MSSRAALIAWASLIGVVALAADRRSPCFTCPVSKLVITEGTLPSPRYGNLGVAGDVQIWPERQTYPPEFTVRMDSSAAAEVVIETGSGAVSWDHVFLAVIQGKSQRITGSFVFHRDGKKSYVHFRLPENANTVRAGEWFQYGRAARMDRIYRSYLRDDNMPGQAWFRQYLSEAERLRSKELPDLWQRRGEPRSSNKQFSREPLEPNGNWVRRITFDDLSTSPQRAFANRGGYAELLSGGRAVSENLQLDRQLRMSGENKNTPDVRIDTLKGITIRPYDWGPHIQGLKPTVDPLAALIPADQHAVFFPDVAAALSVLDEIDRTGLGIFNLTVVRSVDDRITDRYKKQLAIPGAQIAKLLPSTLVGSVAVTGSDVYFDTGTDVAVLLAANQPDLIKQLLLATWPAVRAANPDAVEADEKVSDINCRVLRTPDRRVCAYVCVVKGAVLLTNSPAQIRRLGARPADVATLDTLPEYTFFRERYRRGEADETAFVLLSDDAIRRWCGPRWRIGHQRRIRTGSLLADVQAKYLTDMVAAKKPRAIDEPGLGPIEIGTHSVRSAIHGTRLFQTPIAEVDIDEVAWSEAEAYTRWCNSYQQNWSQYFDPIAIRLTLTPKRVAADVSVMPLIARSDYRHWVDLSAGAKLSPNAGDPHPETIAHFALAFNRANDSFAERMDANFPKFRPDAVPISNWVGDWLTVYADEDPLWDEFGKSTEREWAFWERHRYQVPIALAVAIRDPAKFAEFQTQARDYVKAMSGTSVGMQEKKYRDVDFMRWRLLTNPGGKGPEVYSLTLTDMWMVTMNENVLKRAIDRHLDRKNGKQFAGPAWRGDSVELRAKPQAAQYLREWWGRSMLSSMQSASWANLPILNEWRTMNDSINPIDFHERWWGERLLCPTGGSYIWNENDGTMESKQLGHPGRPKGTAGMMPGLVNSIRAAQFGITFEREGLRARVNIQRE